MWFVLERILVNLVWSAWPGWCRWLFHKYVCSSLSGALKLCKTESSTHRISCPSCQPFCVISSYSAGSILLLQWPGIQLDVFWIKRLPSYDGAKSVLFSHCHTNQHANRNQNETHVDFSCRWKLLLLSLWYHLSLLLPLPW